MINIIANKKGINLSNRTGQLWSVHKSQVVETIPNSCFVAEISPPHIPLVLPVVWWQNGISWLILHCHLMV